MSILARILGRRPAPTLPPPPPPPRGDLLSLTGPGLAGTDLSGEIEVAITVAGRTYTASATRRAPGEFALHDFREIVPDEPAPVAADEPVVVVARTSPSWSSPDEPVVVRPHRSRVRRARAVVVDEPAWSSRRTSPRSSPPSRSRRPSPSPRPPRSSSRSRIRTRSPSCGCRSPIPSGTSSATSSSSTPRTDGGAKATAALLLDAFGDIGLERLAGRHAAWVTMTPEFLLEVGTPPVRPDRVVLQLPAAPPTDDVLSALQRLQFSGYTIALDGYDAALAAVAKMVRIPVAGRSDDELKSAIAEPAARGLELVATGVATPEELERCSALGFTIFQGAFFGRPDHTRQRRVGTGGIASLAALAAVAHPDASFEDLEHAIGNDVGLSLKLLRYVNSAFFALPRTVETVREALTLLGTATVRRWATVMALVSAADDAPEELVELALQRARMCEVLGGNRALDASDGHFTVGLFSVADALLGSSMEDVLETLPFSDEIRAALLNREGPKGELLDTVVEYEQGEFPTDDGEVPLSSAYGESVTWAGEAVGSV